MRARSMATKKDRVARRIAAQHKRCPRCGRTLPFDDFGSSRGKPDGRDSYCLPCKRTIKAGRDAKRKLAALAAACAEVRAAREADAAWLEFQVRSACRTGVIVKFPKANAAEELRCTAFVVRYRTGLDRVTALRVACMIEPFRDGGHYRDRVQVAAWLTDGHLAGLVELASPSVPRRAGQRS